MFGGVAAQALGSVFDEDGGALNAEVGGGTFFGGAAPGEPGFGDVLFHFVHFGFGGGFVEDAGPFAGEVEEHFALFVGEGGGFDAFGSDGFAVASGAENEVAHFGADDGLFALGFVEGID